MPTTKPDAGTAPGRQRAVEVWVALRADATGAAAAPDLATVAYHREGAEFKAGESARSSAWAAKNAVLEIAHGLLYLDD